MNAASGRPVRTGSLRTLVEQTGAVGLLARDTLSALVRTRLDGRAFLHQLEQLGVRSLSIAAATALFSGVVMAIQFAYSLERFGARDMVGRIVVLSETRELAPALTGIVVGCRIGAGMAAELGAMKVTEQIDAIRALGADPVRRLVVPRVLGSIVVMPLLTCFSLLVAVLAAAAMSYVAYGVSFPFFLSSGADSVSLYDFLSGIGKTPFFGLLIGVIGCYCGLATEGGTEGVGRSTTRAVVAVAIAVLVADTLLTQIFVAL